MRKAFFITALFLGGITVASAQVQQKTQFKKEAEQKIRKVDELNDRAQETKQIRQEGLKNETPTKEAKEVGLKKKSQATSVKQSQKQSRNLNAAKNQKVESSVNRDIDKTKQLSKEATLKNANRSKQLDREDIE